MPGTQIDSLELEIQSNAQSATSGVDALTKSLTSLKKAVGGGLGLRAVANQMDALNKSASSMNSDTPQKISSLASALQKLSGLGSLKLSSSIANQITNIGTAINSLSGTNYNGITQLATALQPLTTLGKTNLSSFITQLGKIPQLATTLNSVNWTNFTSNIQHLSTALTPLASQLNAVSTAFSRLPTRIQQTVTATNNLATSNNVARKSYVNLYAAIRMAITGIRSVARVVAGWINEANQYVESLNLFNASMGKYAEEAQNYANKVSEILGIDPAEWMRNEGTFNTIIKGFGVVEDKAYKMSQNLTQLGYDISSFYNISVEDAMQKVSSGISGELEPLRRLGYDLSVARLQQDALNLGITKSVSKMTQAEKAQLRYWEMMKQVTTVQGDMARTLKAPANQLRILKAQLVMAARALGNIFIPMLNAALPYVIAFAKAVRAAADAVSNMMGFELPTVDYSSLNTSSDILGVLADSTEDTADNLADAASEAKKLKRTIMGFDELNVLNDNTDTSSNSDSLNDALDGLGGDLGIELPEYDFLSDAITKNIDEIEKKLKAILPYIAAIGAALAAWSVGNLLKHLGLLPASLKQIAGLALAIGGAVLYIWEYCDAWVNGLDWKNFIGILAGMAAVIGGLALAFGGVGAAIGAVITGIPLLVLGIKDAFENGLNKINFGAMIVGAVAASLGAIKLGSVLAPVIGRMFGIELSAEVGGAIAGGAVAAASGIALFITGIWDAIKNGLNWLNGILIPTGSSLAGAGIGAIIGSLGGPIGAGIGALIGLAIGLVTDGIIAIVQHWEQISSWFSEKWAGVVAWWTQTALPFIQGIPGKIGEVLTSIGTWFSTKWEELSTFLSGVPVKIGEVVSAIVQWFSELPGEIGYALGYALGAIAGWAVDTYNYLSEKIPQIIGNVTRWFSELPGKIYSAISSAVTKIAEWANGIWSYLSTTIPKIVGGVVQWFSELPGKIYDAITGAISAISNWATGMINKVKEVVPGIIKSIVDFFKELPGKLKDLGVDIWNGLINGLTQAWNNITKAISSFVKGFIDGFRNGFGIHSPSTVMQNIGLNLVYGLQNGLGTIGTVFTNIFKTISGGISGFGKNMYTWGSEMMGNLVTGINSGLSTLAQKVASAAATIRSYLHFSQPDVGPLADFNSWMPDMMSQLAGGIADNEDQVKKQVAKLAGDMSLESTVKANVTGSGAAPVGATVGDNTSGLVSAVYTAVANALAAQNGGDDDGGQPIIINLGNEQIASYLVKQNKRVALISGGKA